MELPGRGCAGCVKRERGKVVGVAVAVVLHVLPSNAITLLIHILLV